jgi:hypothetical protein
MCGQNNRSKTRLSQHQNIIGTRARPQYQTTSRAQLTRYSVMICSFLARQILARSIHMISEAARTHMPCILKALSNDVNILWTCKDVIHIAASQTVNRGYLQSVSIDRHTIITLKSETQASPISPQPQLAPQGKTGPCHWCHCW